MKTLGEKIYELRRKNGLSQEQLSYELDVARQTISKWESGAMQPTTENIQALCDFFHVDLNFFLNDEKISVKEQQIATISATNAVESKTYFSKRTVILFALLAALSAMILALCIIIGCIAINIDNEPSLGYTEVQVLQVNWVSIVCFIFAGCAFVCMLTLIILLIIRRKRKM